MEPLIKKRAVQKGNMTRLQTFLDGIQQGVKLAHQEVQVRLDNLQHHWTQYEEVQAEIEEQCNDDNEINEQGRIRGEDEEKYTLLKVRLLQLLDTAEVAGTVKNPQPTPISSTSNLPKIDLPSFSGSYTDWHSFRDLFTVLVHDDPNLKPVQKFNYLKSCLKGEANQLIKGLSPTDANYGKAWEIITARYQNPRRIAYVHFKNILGQPQLTNETASKLRPLVDSFIENMEALETLGANNWDSLMTHVITEKLDPETRKAWEFSLTETKIPGFNDLKEFLMVRCQALEVIPKANPSIKRSDSHFKTKKSSLAASMEKEKDLCPICSKEHPLFRCDKLLNMPVMERIAAVKNARRCYNCLGKFHGAPTCQSQGCRKCNRRHHTLLHVDNWGRSQSNQANGQGSNVNAQVTQVHQPETTQVTSAASQFSSNVAILPTVLVEASNDDGSTFKCRALLDSGSQVNFISERVVRMLNLKRNKNPITINGIGNRSTPARGRTTVTLHAINSSFQVNVDALILVKITGDLPASSIQVSRNWKIPSNIAMADPEFYLSKPIDILLGINTFMSLLESSDTIHHAGLSLFNTKFGWVAGGGIQNKDLPPTTAHSSVIEENLEEQLKKFWQIEEVTTSSLLTDEEKRCETHFMETHQREPDGRYIVRLPFQASSPNLGNSRQQAMSRFLVQEKRLCQQTEVQKEYSDFMKEYEDLGHMTPVTTTQVASPNYYFPHQAVMRESSVSTKLRVVFDGSAKTTSGKSLNNELMVGPIVQDDLSSLLMRFRSHPVALTADITKMFRQVKVHEDDWRYQQILWRDEPTARLQEYQLTTVTYGTACGPFLATRVLQQLAEDEKSRFPEAANILANDFYVDDCITGCDTPEQAKRVQDELQKLLKRGGFELRKWASNDQAAIEKTDEISLHHFPDPQVPALGLTWSPKEDIFTITPRLKEATKFTKRTILGDISRLFDPIGIVSPVTISAKILMQRLWIAGLDWDQELSQELESAWINMREDLQSLPTVQIPRFLGTEPGSTVELHGFSDASEKAYGAVIYTRSISKEGEIRIGLLCSKSKVAPLKSTTLPRLELCAAVLLTRLIKNVRKAVKFKFESITGWTDSKVTLSWIQGEPRKWKTFVANRVAEIQETLAPAHWRHVKGIDNPADLVSRGTTTSDLRNSKLWWNGPDWLTGPIPPVSTPLNEPESWVEVRSFASRVQATTPDTGWTEHFSPWSKLLAITAWMLRFIHNARSKSDKRRGILSSKEIEDARIELCRLTQRDNFRQEIKDLEAGRPVSNKSLLQPLNPMLHEGLIRVGGRIKNAELPFDQMHQIILPAKSHVTKLVVQYEHVTQMHSQVTLLLSSLRRRYWIIHGRDVIRQVIHRCLPCFRMKATSHQQLMGNLPPPRINAPRAAFLHCGIDYAGPIIVKARGGRGRPITSKAYIALFICLATKAIHLELVSSLTAEACVATIRRFIARRGCPTDIYSDQGTNFKKAADILALMEIQGPAATRLQSVKWHFNPPAAPHFGGVWEAGVKSVKTHLHRTIGTAILTFEELYTVLTQIEACLNSRPLCQISDNPESLDYLTPGHFLIGTALTAPVEESEPVCKQTHQERWLHLQERLRQFWKRWTTEYVTSLQQRPKWRTTTRNLEVNDLVLLKEPTTPLQWPIGRITEVHPGADDIVRAVTVKTAKGTYQRPITKICPLPIAEC